MFSHNNKWYVTVWIKINYIHEYKSLESLDKLHTKIIVYNYIYKDDDDSSEFTASGGGGKIFF